MPIVGIIFFPAQLQRLYKYNRRRSYQHVDSLSASQHGDICWFAPHIGAAAVHHREKVEAEVIAVDECPWHEVTPKAMVLSATH